MSEDFFSSRFLERPVAVAPSDALPQGFRLAGVACGIKTAGSSELDLGLVVSDSEGTVSAARFCDSGVLAAPVLVAVTGWGQEKDKDRAFDAGFDHHLTKPIDPAALESLLQSID